MSHTTKKFALFPLLIKDTFCKAAAHSFRVKVNLHRLQLTIQLRTAGEQEFFFAYLYNRTDTRWVPTSHSRTKLPEETEEEEGEEEGALSHYLQEEEEAAVVDGERRRRRRRSSLSLIWRKVIEVRSFLRQAAKSR